MPPLGTFQKTLKRNDNPNKLIQYFVQKPAPPGSFAGRDHLVR